MTSPAANKARVLIVEDETPLTKELSGLLRSWGYEVAGTTSSAEDAVEIAADTRPDLILMDISPRADMALIEAASRIKSRMDVAVVYLTGHSETDMPDRVEGSEFFAYITRPLSPAGLEHTLDMVVCRHTTEKRLRASETRFRLAMEATNEGLWDWNIATDEVYRSPAFFAMLGCEPDEFPPGFDEWTRRIHDEDRGRVRETLHNYFSGQSPEYAVEFRMCHKAGHHVWILSRGKIVEYDAAGKPLRMIGTHTDITERRKAEEELERKRLLLEEAEKLAAVGAWEWDIVRDEFHMSREWLRIHGTHNPALTSETLLPLAHPDDHAAIERAFQQAMDTGSPYEIVHRIIRPTDGEERVVQAYGYVVRDATGTPVRMYGAAQDITERRQTEQELQAGKQRLDTIFEEHPDSISLTRLSDGAFLEVNKALTQVMGYTREEIVGVPSHQLGNYLDENDRTRMIEQLEKTGRVDQQEIAFRRKDGSVVYASLSAAGVTMGGEPCVLAVTRDITDRKQAQDQLRESKEMLSLALEAANMGCWDWDLTTGNAAWSERNHQMLGYRTDEFTPNLKNWKRLVHPHDWPEVARRLNLHLEGRAPVYDVEYRMRNKAGEWQWFHGLGKVVRFADDGAPVRMTGVILDVTERKKAEHELRDNHRRLEQSQRIANIGTWEWDVNTGRTYWSNQVYSIFGLEPGSMTPSYELAQEVTHPEDRRKWRDAVSDSLARKQTFELDYRAIRSDGTVIWIHNQGEVIRDRDGKPLRMLGTAQDITDLKRSQELVLHAEKYKAVADLSTGVAHNFNNLLQIVIGNTELALLDVESGEFREIQQKLSEIHRVSRMGAETVRRLNRFVRRGEPGAQEEIATFDLSDAVQQVVDMSMPLWKEEPQKRGLTLSLDCRLREGCIIQGAKGDIFDVILNLVKNAVEALPEGGDIEIDTLRKGDEVILRVRDTGIGIPAGNINRLFTPFFTTNVEAGRGLGLSTCRTIIESHGGHILVQSTQGAGTTFTVKLPFAVRQEDRATQRPPVTPLKPLRILVIDDMEGTVTLLKRALERMGHAVLTALSGEEGLRLLEDTPVDLVICDLGMPGMNGRQVGEAIAQRCSRQELRRPRFIVLTGWGGQALETEQMTASEVDAVIEKPVDSAKLVEVISRLVGAESEKT